MQRVCTAADPPCQHGPHRPDHPDELPAGASVADTAELRPTQAVLLAAQRDLGLAQGRLAERDAHVKVLTEQVAAACGIV